MSLRWRLSLVLSVLCGCGGAPAQTEPAGDAAGDAPSDQQSEGQTRGAALDDDAAAAQRSGYADPKAPERSWAQVKPALDEAKLIARMQACVDAFKAKPGKAIKHRLWIHPDGTLEHEKRGRLGTETFEYCLMKTTEGLRFEKSRNKMEIALEWGADKKLSKVEGKTVEPRGCELKGYACSAKDVIPERQAMGEQYRHNYISYHDCDDPEPAIAWLKKQPHVVGVVNDSCKVRFYVEGALPFCWEPPRKRRTGNEPKTRCIGTRCIEFDWCD